jgi:hypothetical protein
LINLLDKWDYLQKVNTGGMLELQQTPFNQPNPVNVTNASTAAVDNRETRSGQAGYFEYQF